MIVPSSKENIQKAANLLKEGGIIAFPTETVYGIGCDAGNNASVERVFQTKKRPKNKPLAFHLHSIDQIYEVASINHNKRLFHQIDQLKIFWPGPLSLVLPRDPSSNSSVAVRFPSHPVSISLLKECSIPIAATSANISSQPSPTSAKHVEEALGHSIDMILDGGVCSVGIESTMLSLLDHVPTILRPGPISVEQLREVLGEIYV